MGKKSYERRRRAPVRPMNLSRRNFYYLHFIVFQFLFEPINYDVFIVQRINFLELLKLQLNFWPRQLLFSFLLHHRMEKTNENVENEVVAAAECFITIRPSINRNDGKFLSSSTSNLHFTWHHHETSFFKQWKAQDVRFLLLHNTPFIHFLTRQRRKPQLFRYS